MLGALFTSTGWYCTTTKRPAAITAMRTTLISWKVQAKSSAKKPPIAMWATGT